MAALQKVRAIGMIEGSLLADAATMGLHWIYDQNIISEKLAGGKDPCFFDPPSCPFYTYDQGKYSPYGDEVVPFLNAVSASREFDTDAISASCYDFFKSYSGRLNSCCKKFVENRDAGNSWYDCRVEHHEAQGIIKVPLFVARYGGTAELLDRVDDAVNIIQNSPQSQHASKLLAVILERVLLSEDTPAEAIRWASNDDQSSRLGSEPAKLLSLVLNQPLLHAWSRFHVALGEGMELFPHIMLSGKLFAAVRQSLDLQSALAAADLTDAEREHVERACGAMHAVHAVTLQQEVAALGLSCGLPGSLLSSLHIALKCGSYQEAISENIRCGGDNCSRAIVIGGLFAGANPDSIPEEWMNRLDVNLRSRLQQQAEQIVDFRE